ncbi:MAG: UDP-glucose 4-epimerase GalE [Firmicutes bacterium]|nr:UDP-glucose 4-epimerase GalE [Bacillota bacterium]
MAAGRWVLVTGGAGYVAGCTVRALLAEGYRVTVLDDLSTGHADAVPPECELVRGRVGDAAVTAPLFARPGLAAVFHFAARTSVPESVADPLAYYETNLVESVALVRAVVAAPSRPLFVFSSSAAVYGHPDRSPVSEASPALPISPYGETKRATEALLAWAERAYGLRWAALRYFNAAGAAPGVVERHEPEGHLVPNLLRAARGGPPATLYGTDYPTDDGTAVRDYVHVLDLAEGHLLAMRHLEAGGASMALNLGSGQGTSVRQVLAAVEAAVGAPVPHRWGERRPGDPPHLVADISLARRVLGYAPRASDIARVVADAWRYGRFPSER